MMKAFELEEGVMDVVFYTGNYKLTVHRKPRLFLFLATKNGLDGSSRIIGHSEADHNNGLLAITWLCSPVLAL